MAWFIGLCHRVGTATLWYPYMVDFLLFLPLVCECFHKSCRPYLKLDSYTVVSCVTGISECLTKNFILVVNILLHFWCQVLITHAVRTLSDKLNQMVLESSRLPTSSLQLIWLVTTRPLLPVLLSSHPKLVTLHLYSPQSKIVGPCEFSHLKCLISSFFLSTVSFWYNTQNTCMFFLHVC